MDGGCVSAMVKWNTKNQNKKQNPQQTEEMEDDLPISRLRVYKKAVASIFGKSSAAWLEDVCLIAVVFGCLVCA